MGVKKADRQRVFELGVGKRLREIRTERGISAERFAEIIGVPAPTLFKWEREGLSSLYRALIICRKLEIALADLLKYAIYQK